MWREAAEEEEEGVGVERKGRRVISFVFYMQKEIARCVFGASRIHRCCKNATY